jgi:hypothetical protein
MQTILIIILGLLTLILGFLWYWCLVVIGRQDQALRRLHGELHDVTTQLERVTKLLRIQTEIIELQNLESER